MSTLNTFLKLSRPMLIWSPTVVCFNTFQSDKRNHNKKKIIKIRSVAFKTLPLKF